jgi:tripartite-type tricarboxylate transporter receptor subunit TctC
MRIDHAICIISALIFALIGTALAQTYPSKPVRIIVPSFAGGSDDLVARIVASKLGDSLGQQFIADNRPGAAGMIGQTLAARSPADGYTLLLAGGSMAGAQYVNANTTYDVLRDFTPISLVEISPFVLVVHPSVPARSVKEYIALGRSHPGKLTYVTSGAGQIPYWNAVMFNNLARIDALEIQYKDLSAGMTDLIAGRVDYYFAAIVVALGNKEKLRLLGVTTATRSAMLPDVPTIAEAALPGYDLPGWRSIMGPAAMRREVVDSLNSAIGRALATADLRERFYKAGSEPAPSTPEELAARYAEWVAKFGKMSKDLGIKPH